MARKRKKGYRSRKRSAAAKRAYRKSGLYKYNLRRKKRRGGKRKKRRGGKRKRSSSRRRRAYSRRRAGGLSSKGHQVYQTLINRGRTPQQAYKVASRIDRMRSGRVKRYFQREAVQAKSAQALHNVFAGIGSAGHLAAMQKA